jgi:SNF2 family DNA or RNA helicase
MHNVVFYLKDVKPVLKCNVIVVPFSLCTQWETYIKTFKGDLTYKIVNKTKSITEMVGKARETLSNFDIILVASTFYNKFADMVKSENIKFQRIFYDEADNLNINNCSPLDANFIWFVTASYGNIMYPKGFAKQDRILNRYIWCADGIKTTGFIKNIFNDTNYTLPKAALKTLIIKNTEAYVQKSIELPHINSYIVKSKTPKTINILNGIVDKNIITCLNAGDVQKALQYISPHQKLSEENIISVVVDKYKKQINNIQVRISMLDQLHYEDPNERTREATNLANKQKEIERVIKMIEERIVNTNMCNICYDDHDNKTIVNCCQNTFCFKCINLWLSKKAMCPLCKSVINTNDLLVLSHNAPVQELPKILDEQLVTIGGIPNFSVKNEKTTNLEIIVQSKMNAKILIFSCYDTSLMSITPILNKHGIKYDYLKGNGGHINNVIRNYKTGDTNVLLVNTMYFGSGFNMENTTDIIMFHKFDSEIEKQVIGRAQRIGRTLPLNVWYLVHDNEM